MFNTSVQLSWSILRMPLCHSHPQSCQLTLKQTTVIPSSYVRNYRGTLRKTTVVPKIRRTAFQHVVCNIAVAQMNLANTCSKCSLNLKTSTQEAQNLPTTMLADMSASTLFGYAGRLRRFSLNVDDDKKHTFEH